MNNGLNDHLGAVNDNIITTGAYLSCNNDINGRERQMRKGKEEEKEKEKKKEKEKEKDDLSEDNREFPVISFSKDPYHADNNDEVERGSNLSNFSSRKSSFSSSHLSNGPQFL